MNLFLISGSCPELLLPHRVLKANEDLKEIIIDHVACDCSPPLDIVKTCKNGTKTLPVSSFRKSCSIHPEENSTQISARMMDNRILDCPNLGPDFTHFLWITPLGNFREIRLKTIKFGIHCHPAAKHYAQNFCFPYDLL